MKWLYLPWHYRSADNATRVCNTILYILSALLVVSMFTLGCQMIHVQLFHQQINHVRTNRKTQFIPRKIDHRDYHYIYRTNKSKYQDAQNTILNTIRVAKQHDLSSTTNRIYWLKKYFNNNVLSNPNFALVNHPINPKSVWMGFNDNPKDNKNVQFIVRGRSYDQDDPNDNTQTYPIIMTGSLNISSQKITNLSSLND